MARAAAELGSWGEPTDRSLASLGHRTAQTRWSTDRNQPNRSPSAAARPEPTELRSVGPWGGPWPAHRVPDTRPERAAFPSTRLLPYAQHVAPSALTHLFVHVTSLEATRHFYIDYLGLEVLTDDEGYLRVGGGDGFHMGFEERDWADVGAPGIQINVRVDDVDETWRRLREEGVPMSGPPEDQEWGTRQAWLFDPDGYRLSIYSPIDR